MEGIRSYSSDSDNQEEPEDNKPEETSSQSSPDESLKQASVEEVAPRNNTPKSCSKSTASFNFLGLETVDRRSSQNFRDSQSHNEKKEIRKIQTSCGEVEIPNGDFWSDFTPDYESIVTGQGADNSGHHQRQTERVDAHGNFSTNSAISQGDTHKRLHCGNTVGITKFDDDNSKKIRLSDQNAVPSCGSEAHPHGLFQQRQSLHICPTENSGQTKICEKRKMYFVHSKVSPYVNITPVNKCAGKLTNSWSAHDGVVNRLAWNVPNFSHLLLTAGMDTSVRVWNVWSSLDLCVATLSNHKKAVKHVEWCQSGRKVLSCSYDRTAQVTDVETAKILGQYDHMGFVTAGQMHPANPNLFVTGTDGMILKWDTRTPQAPVRCFSYKDKFGQVEDLLFINHGQEFVSCSDLVSRDCADRSIMVWDLRVGTVLSNQIFQERYMCTRLKLHPNKSIFMAQTHAGYIALFSAASPYKMDKSKRYEGHKVQGHNIGFDISPDGGLVYSGSSGDGINCYHQHSGKLVRKLSSRHETITDVACHPVLPSLLASCTWGGSVQLWK